ncbi:MAG TPA: YqgE/AlgH family protein [Flavipsychrobacter sp.]|nr:YqgE/AlgH family protein [Flavipsychrobacter sp.]
MNFLNLNKPINKLKPQVGRLLIAEPFLNDPNFARSVILICEHGEEGTVGFALNRTTELTLGDLLPELYTPLKVFQGGPVQMDTLHMIHRIPQILDGNELNKGVYWGGSYEALQEAIINKICKPADIRLFIGYSGWSPGQLERELLENSWIVADMASELLFETEPEDVWKRAISLLGSDFAYLANMPTNPQLN